MQHKLRRIFQYFDPPSICLQLFHHFLLCNSQNIKIFTKQTVVFCLQSSRLKNSPFSFAEILFQFCFWFILISITSFLRIIFPSYFKSSGNRKVYSCFYLLKCLNDSFKLHYEMSSGLVICDILNLSSISLCQCRFVFSMNFYFEIFTIF